MDQSGSAHLYGPESCLLETNTCPLGFVLALMCLRDDSVCDGGDSFESYQLDVFRYFERYKYDILIRSGIEISPLEFAELDDRVLHDIYEATVCYIDTPACMGPAPHLTIYGERQGFIGGCFQNDEDCSGGPTDAGVCQSNPEACAGTYR